MRKKILHVKKRFAEYAATLKRLGRPVKKEHWVSDIGREGKRSQTVMLREKVLRIELSRKTIKRFFVRNKKLTTGVLAAVVVGIFIRYIVVGFASTADFYPSSCLGNWDNVQNAMGKPDVSFGSPASAFTSLNSAMFGTSTSQMFCGNFSGDTSIVDLAGKSFEKADLVLSWVSVFPADATTSPSSGSVIGSGGATGGGGGGGDTGSVVAPPEVAPAPAPALAPASTTGSEASTSPDLNTGSVLGAASSSATSSDVTSGMDATSTPSSSDSIATSSGVMLVTDVSSTASSTEAPVVAPPAPPDPPAPSSSSSSNTTSTSWLMRFLPIAFADETSSIVSSSVTTDTTEASATPNPPPPAPTLMTVNTSMFQNIVLPSSTPDDFLGIVYSTDGVTWQPIININKDNWQTMRYPIPITSWDELQHLQIAFVGLGMQNAPLIYLDAVGVEVNYADNPAGTTNIAPAPAPDAQPSANTESSSSAPLPPPLPADVLQQPTISESDIFEQGARQQCVVAPFSQEATPGGSVNFSLQLFSGLLTPSSTSQPNIASSTSPPLPPQGYQHPIYQTRIGSLPVGVTASIKAGAASDATSTETIHMNISAGAQRGSYSVLVMYRERQDDASLRSTGCQLNLVIQ